MTSPAPWRWDEGGELLDADGAATGVHADHHPFEPTLPEKFRQPYKANFAVIAAAPELRAMVNELEVTLRDLHDQVDRKGLYEDDTRKGVVKTLSGARELLGRA